MSAPIDFKYQEVGFPTHSDGCSVFHFIKMQQNAGYNLHTMLVYGHSLKEHKRLKKTQPTIVSL